MNSLQDCSGKGAALATPSRAKLDMVSSDFNELRDAFGSRTYVCECVLVIFLVAFVWRLH